MTAVLTPLDGSRFAESAIPLALTAATALNADVHVVRVHELVAVPSMDAITPMPVIDAAFEEETRKDQRLELETTAADLRRYAHRPVHAALLEGSVVRAIIAYARAHDVRLIVTSTHGRSGLARAAMGSVAEELAREAPIPVLLLHPVDGAAPAAPRSLQHVLVPLDGTALAEAVIPAATMLLSGARRVTLFRMVAPVTVDLAPTPMPVSMTDSLALEGDLAAARDYLDGVANTLRAEGFTVDVEVTANVATPSAIEEAVTSHAPDFVAISTHGRSGLMRFLLGSVTETIIARLAVPVLAFHPPGA